MATLLTIGHGTDTVESFIDRCRRAGVHQVVDVRSAPGSRRVPHFNRDRMGAWLAEADIAYRWEPELGGFRRPRPDSLNAGLRHASFRGYADHMAGDAFGAAMRSLVDDLDEHGHAVMCSEALWWRCHRRLIADCAVLVHGVRVLHVTSRGTLEPHHVTPEAVPHGASVRYPPPSG